MSREYFSPIVELRMYTLRKDRRDEMIELFDRALIEPREAVGIRILGQFRDLDKPNRWTWLQGFNDMESRRESLHAFYTSAAWLENRKAANVTIRDSENVLLLRQVHATSGFKLTPGERPPLGSTKAREGFVSVTICYFEQPATPEFIHYFEKTIQPVLTNTGAEVLAYFVTEESPNSYPRLAIREGEHVFVWFTKFRDEESHKRQNEALAESKDWAEVMASLKKKFNSKLEVMRLKPTARSWLA